MDVILTANYSPWSSYHGGIQKSVDQLARAMTAQGAQVTAVFSRGCSETIQAPELPYNVRWARFFGFHPNISSPLRIWNALSFRNLIKDIKHPHTIIQSNGDEAWAFKNLVRGRHLYTHRQPFFPAYLQGDWDLPLHQCRVFLRNTREWSYAQALFAADQVACTSKFSLDALRSTYGYERGIQIIPNGIDATFLQTELPDQKAYIAYFGRLSRGKGVQELVEAWAQLNAPFRKRFPLFLAGSGELEPWIRKFSQALPNDEIIQLCGTLYGQQLSSFVGRASLVVLPSQSESFGNTALEAIAMGHQIIAVRAGALPEVVGSHADWLQSVSIAELVSKLTSRLENWRPEPLTLRQARRDWVQQNFSWDKAARLFLAEHEKIRMRHPN